MTHCGFLTLVAFVVVLLQPIELNADSVYKPASKRSSDFDISMSLPVPACVRYQFLFWRYVCFFQCTDYGELKTDCARNWEYPAVEPCDDLYCLARKGEANPEKGTTEKAEEPWTTTEDFTTLASAEVLESAISEPVNWDEPQGHEKSKNDSTTDITAVLKK